MPKTKGGDDHQKPKSKGPPLDRAGRRSSPVNEGEGEEGAADLQPDDVESGDTAR